LSAWIVPGALVLLIAAIALVAAGGGLDWRLLSLTTQDVESFAQAWGAWSAVASILLMVLHSFVPLPAEVIAIANGMLFGPILGIAITWAGAMMGAALSFAFARGIGRPLAKRLVSERRWRTIETWNARPSTLLLVRLIPVISFNLVNYATGVTGIGWWTFLWTTGLGILPITAASVIFGDRMMSITWPLWLLIAAGVVVLWLVWRFVAQRFAALRPNED